MASLLNMSGGSLLGKGLPYDAEIEYLESSGTQYIATDYIPVNNTGVEVKYMPVRDDLSKDMGHRPFGGQVAWMNKNFGITTPIANDNECYFVLGNKYNQFRRNGLYNAIHIAILYQNKPNSYFDNYPIPTVGNGDFTYTIPLYLFAYNSNGTPRYSRTLRMYYCKIFEDDDLKFDFIPVRVGNVGYMYDKISNQLFGNSGTGDFILGPDK